MASLRADRRLYLTAEKDQIVEEGDPRSAYLLAGVGGEISSSDVARLDLSHRDGKVVYPGYETAGKPQAKAAPKPEDKQMPAPENKSAVPEEEPDDDPEWDMKMGPEEYLSRFPDGPNADLARRLIGDEES